MLTPQPTWFHAQSSIEQLIELQLTADGTIIQTETPPLNLFGQEGRNWEGIVRFNNSGFLLVTDQYPKTYFGFVPIPPRFIECP